VGGVLGVGAFELSNGSRYQGFVGRMNNRYAGIWVCLNWPGGGRCTEAKYE
jgi:hypothetical protein